MDLDHQQAHPVDVRREMKVELALGLRIKGYSYRKIAAELGISLKSSHDYVTTALRDLRETNAELAEEARQIELQRLDAMIEKLWPRSAEGEKPEGDLDPRTADTLLRIGERRARLLGLDAPTNLGLAGIGGGPIPISGDLDLRNLTMEQLLELERIIKAATPRPVAVASSPASVPALASPTEPL